MVVDGSNPVQALDEPAHARHVASQPTTTAASESIDPNGALEATHFNPNRLPFAKRKQGGKARPCVSSSNCRGQHAGSSCNVTCDPASDRLRGICYQVVAKQKFEVCFARK